MILMQAISIYKGHSKEWSLKSRLFWALKWQQEKRVPFGAQLSQDFRTHLSNGPSIGFACIKFIKSKRHIKKVHWYFYVHEFQGPPLPMATGIVVDGGGGKDSFPGPPCILSKHEFCSRARIFKLLRIPRINSMESILSAYKA